MAPPAALNDFRDHQNRAPAESLLDSNYLPLRSPTLAFLVSTLFRGVTGLPLLLQVLFFPPVMKRLLRALPAFSLMLLSAALGRAAEAQTVVLANGTTLVGEIVSESASELTFKDSVLGLVKVPTHAIKSRPSGESSHEVNAASKPAAAAAPALAVTAVPTTGGTAASANANPVKWTRSLQLSWGYMSGPAPSLGAGASRNLSANFAIERATAKNIAGLGANYNFARAKPAPPYANNASVYFQYDYILSPKNRIVSRTDWVRNPIQSINHRTEELIGFVRTLVQTPTTNLLLGPGLGYSFGQKEYVGDLDNHHFGYGFYQVFSHAFSPTISLQQRLFLFRSVEDSKYIISSGSVSLTAQLTKTLALQSSLNAAYDGRPVPGTEELQIQTNTGLRIQF